MTLEASASWSVHSQNSVWFDPTVPAAGPKPLLEILVVFLCRQITSRSMWGKGYNWGHRKIVFVYLLIFFFLFVFFYYCSFLLVYFHNFLFFMLLFLNTFFSYIHRSFLLYCIFSIFLILYFCWSTFWCLFSFMGLYIALIASFFLIPLFVISFIPSLFVSVIM